MNGKRGGSRKHPKDCTCGHCPQIGRPKSKPEVTVAGDKSFASRVLARIGKPGWLKFSDLKAVSNDEEYALHVLTLGRGEDQFNKLLDRKYGKPVQTVNHLHDKPIEMNVTVSLAETIQKARKRAGL